MTSRQKRDATFLYVNLACPWAHRALIMLSLKGLEDTISVLVVHWLMLDFADGPGVIPDTVYANRGAERQDRRTATWQEFFR